MFIAGRARLGSWFTVLASCIAQVVFAHPALGEELRVLLMVVDGNQQIPRSLRHYENNQVTNTNWTNASTIHEFAFDRDTSFASLYEEMSYGQLTITGDTVLMALPYDASEFTWGEWAKRTACSVQSPSRLRATSAALAMACVKSLVRTVSDNHPRSTVWRGLTSV